jgi:hypothetical protein
MMNSDWYHDDYIREINTFNKTLRMSLYGFTILTVVRLGIKLYNIQFNRTPTTATDDDDDEF